MHKAKEIEEKRFLSIQKAFDLSENRPSIILGGNYPFPILHTNATWIKLFRYEQGEVEGKTLAFLEGPESNPKNISEVCYLNLVTFLTS